MKFPPTSLAAPALVALVALAGPACGGSGGGGSGAGPAGEPSPGRPAPVATPTPAPRPVLRVVRVRGADVAFVERGTGTPVVFIHGSLGTADSWQQQIDPFASRFRVIAYSRRYHPPSAASPPPPPTPPPPPSRLDDQAYALSVHADDLIALIEALGLERAHLVGASYGAYVALLVTLRRPDLVRSLVLAEPPILPWLARTPDGDSLRRAFEATVLEPVRQAFARGDSAEGLRRFIDGESGRPGRYDALPEVARDGLLRSAFAMRLEMRADPAVYMPTLSCAQVRGIRNPVLLVTGERSPRLFHVITEELARCLPAEEIVAVPGAGHSPHADNPAFYNDAVLGFLLRN